VKVVFRSPETIVCCSSVISNRIEVISGYTRAIDRQKREASLKVVELMLPLEVKKIHHRSAPSEEESTFRGRLKTSAKKGVIWWTWSGSNRRPLPCHGSALPNCATGPRAEGCNSFIVSAAEGFVNARAGRSAGPTRTKRRAQPDEGQAPTAKRQLPGCGDDNHAVEVEQ
jgi:hypothetical protein